jgi:hypothetical protein
MSDVFGGKRESFREAWCVDSEVGIDDDFDAKVKHMPRVRPQILRPSGSSERHGRGGIMLRVGRTVLTGTGHARKRMGVDMATQ